MAGRTHRELPTSIELAIWREHLEAFDVARSRIAARLQQDAGLSSGDYRVLLALSEADARTMRSSQLAEHIDWERSRLSAHLGRMERRGLVRREPCAEDARGSNVVLTDAGAEAFTASTIPHLRAIKEVFVDAFTAQQIAALGEASEAMRAHLHAPSEA